MDIHKKNFAIQALRRASYRWKPRSEAMKRAKIERGKYRCEKCKEIKQRKDIQIDHQHPVIPVLGWDNFDNYIDRMFCDISGFNILCKACHNIKTQSENMIRKSVKKVDKRKRKR